jgi:hypothetical protein
MPPEPPVGPLPPVEVPPFPAFEPALPPWPELEPDVPPVDVPPVDVPPVDVFPALEPALPPFPELDPAVPALDPLAPPEPSLPPVFDSSPPPQAVSIATTGTTAKIASRRVHLKNERADLDGFMVRLLWWPAAEPARATWVSENAAPQRLTFPTGSGTRVRQGYIGGGGPQLRPS